MIDLKPEHIRILVFLLLSIIFLTWEKLVPLKKLHHNYRREKTNIFIFLSGIAVMKIVLPIGLYYFENQAKYQLDILSIDNIIMTYLVFDFALYWQHRLTHEINWLWRLHRVHHYDHELTFSTGLRFHPIEIIFSTCYKLLFCVLFKFDPLGILVFETVLNSSSLFTHSNIQIPKKLRKFIGIFLFTPNLHHIHHSQISSEQRSNYGFILTLWDKIFRTFNIEKDVDKIKLGVKNMRNTDSDDFWYQLKSPFK